MSDSYLAIDFGTSNSLVGAIHKNKKFQALDIDPAAADPSMMRTLLFFPTAQQCFYGSEAIKKYLEFEMEGRLFRSFKSHMPNQNYLGTVLDNRILSLETLVGLFLLELKSRAEKQLGQKINKAVLGRPARYSMDPVSDGFALHRMQKAALFAGFEEVQFVPEPLAAAFDYRKTVDSEKIILIGDFGGGTSDFTLIKLRPNDFQADDVLAIDGCPLAGDAFDSVFMSHYLNQFFGAGSQYRLPFSKNILTMPPSISQRLNHPAHIVHLKEKETYEFIKEVRKCSLRTQDKDAIDRLFLIIEDQQIFPFFESIEKTKRALSNSETAEFNFDYPDLEIKHEFSATDFLKWSESTKSKIFEALDRCFESAQINASDVDLVCLTGGTAQVPMIRKELERRFGAKKLQTQDHFHSVLSGLVEAAEFWSKGKGIVPTVKL